MPDTLYARLGGWVDAVGAPATERGKAPALIESAEAEIVE